MCCSEALGCVCLSNVLKNIQRFVNRAAKGKPSSNPLARIELNALQRFGYAYATDLLRLLVQKGWLENVNINHICDFGTGIGGPALAVQDFFNVPPSQLTLLESHRFQAVRLQRLFPQGKVIKGDGLAWLERQCRKKYDLITTFMLGPGDEEGALALAFILQALASLSSRGRLLICSDTATMRGVQQVLENMQGVCCKWLVDEPNTCLPVCVVVSKSTRDNIETAGLPAMRLSAPIVKSAEIPDAQGYYEIEHYCLTTEFERAYLQATIQAFEAESPEHPGIAAMKKLLD